MGWGWGGGEIGRDGMGMEEKGTDAVWNSRAGVICEGCGATGMAEVIGDGYGVGGTPCDKASISCCMVRIVGTGDPEGVGEAVAGSGRMRLYSGIAFSESALAGWAGEGEETAGDGRTGGGEIVLKETGRSGEATTVSLGREVSA